MKVTIELENDAELTNVLSKLQGLGLTTKEQVESILSSNLLEALRSPFLRRVIRQQFPLEIARKQKLSA